MINLENNTFVDSDLIQHPTINKKDLAVWAPRPLAGWHICILSQGRGAYNELPGVAPIPPPALPALVLAQPLAISDDALS